MHGKILRISKRVTPSVIRSRAGWRYCDPGHPSDYLYPRKASNKQISIEKHCDGEPTSISNTIALQATGYSIETNESKYEWKLDERKQIKVQANVSAKALSTVKSRAGDDTYLDIISDSPN